MALVFKDRVKQKTTTVGSGDLTLIGVDADFQSFSQIGDGNDTHYTITSQNEWEVGVGTYNPSGVSSSWIQLGSDIDGDDANDEMGQSVSLSDDGTIMAIGGNANSAPVKVYELSNEVWVQKGSNIDEEDSGDFAGFSVSLNGDGTVLAIGAYLNDDAGIDAGHVRIYEWSGSAWVQKGSDIDGEAAVDYSGTSVSLNHDGTVVAIGAPDNDDGPGSNAGHVRVYEWNGSAWAQKGADIDGDSSGDNFGGSVDINDDGTVVIAGAINGDAGTTNTGEIKVYEWNGSAWTQKGSTLGGEAAQDSFGSSVSINNDGSVIAVGAYLNDGTDTNAGHVRVFYWDGSDWDQRGDDIDGEAAQDRSGTQTALNGDGTVVAIGACDNDGTGSDAGHVRVYGWNGSAWVQLGADIDGEAAGNESGKAVAISDDGSIVAIGARLNGGFVTGHVRTFVRATLSRNTVLESSNLGNKISTTGTSIVFCTYPAEKSVYRNTNDQIVATASGIVFSDDSVQTTAPVTYTAGTGLSLSGTEFYTANTGNFQQLTFNDGVVRIGASAGSDDISCVSSEFIGAEAGKEASGVTDSQFFGSEAGAQAGNNTNISAIGSTAGSQASGCEECQFLGRSAGSEASNCDNVVMVGHLTGANAVSSENSVIIGTEAGYRSTEVTHSNLIGKNAGDSASGSYNNYIGYHAGDGAAGNYNLEIVNSGASTSILDDKNNKVHIQKVIIGDSADGKLAVGNVGASNLDPDATLEIVSANVNDTGLLVHNLIAAETGVLLPSNVPSTTTNKLYNNGGTLTFNGSAVNTNTTYTAGSGLDLDGTTFNAILTDTINTDQDKALTPKAVNDAAYLTAHPSISAASGSDNSGRTYIQDVLLDGNGHVTGIAIAAETGVESYTAGTGIVLSGTEINVGYIIQDNPALILTENITRLGNSAGEDCGAVNTSVAMVGDHAGAYASGNTQTTMLGPSAGWASSGDTNSNYIGYQAGRQCIGGNHNNYIGYQAGMSSDGSNNLEIVNSGASTSVIGDNSGKVHIQKVIIGDSTDGKLAVGSVGASNLDPDATLEIVSANVNDTGLLVHNLIAAETGILLPSTVPAVTTNKLYNNGGALTFNGSAVNTTYTAGTGITLNGTEFDIDPTLISARTDVTSADADYLLIWDATDSKLKKTDAGEFRGGGGSARSVAGDTDNGVVTWVTSDDTFAVESGLTYTGGTLTATGIIDVTNVLDASDATGDTGAIRTEGGVSIAKKLYVGTDLDVDGTTNLDAVDIDGNVQLDGTFTVGVDGTGKDVKLYGDTAGSYLEWDESEDRLNLVGGAYVNEAVPANDTPTTEDATVTLDLSLGNYHNIVLGANVTKFEFTNAKRGQRFILRITQHASSAKTVGWTDVDSATGVDANLKWAGNITPTMSTTVDHTDVYGFLCTNNVGTIRFDGFIIGQDIPN